MEIGQPEEFPDIVIEPLEDPVPREKPAPTLEPVPEKKPELVPA